MTASEVGAVMDALYEDYQDSWEQTRFISYVQAASAGAKLQKPQDLVRFSWDAEEVKPTAEQLVQTQYDLINAMNKTNKAEFKPFY
jgi:hypothetical protein